MRIAAFSDGHGFLPTLPNADAYLCSGDLLPVENHHLMYQMQWLDTTFRKWAENLNAPLFFTPGNHDLIFSFASHLVPPNLPWTYLEDSGATYDGLNFYGTPHQPNFGYGWAFNGFEHELAEKWAKIPDQTDVLITHGPPYGYFDWSIYDKKYTGSPSLRERIKELPNLKLHCWGHIHGSRNSQIIRGNYDNFIQIANVSICDENYNPINKPMVFDL